MERLIELLNAARDAAGDGYPDRAKNAIMSAQVILDDSVAFAELETAYEHVDYDRLDKAVQVLDVILTRLCPPLTIPDAVSAPAPADKRIETISDLLSVIGFRIDDPRSRQLDAARAAVKELSQNPGPISAREQATAAVAGLSKEALEDLIIDCRARLKDMRTPEETQYIEAAMRLVKEGDLEIDEDTVVSLSEDAGAYVMAWKWVSDDEVTKGAQ